MNIIIKVINTIFLLFVFSSLLVATASASEELQYDSDEQVSIANKTIIPRLQWNAYKKMHDLKDGINPKNGRTFLIAYADQIVGKATNESGFMDSRTIAFNKALLAAKEEMATFLAKDLKSSRSFVLSEFGDEIPNRLKKEVVEPLSIMDKAATLTGLALDNEIKKFDKNWDGTKKTDADRIVKMAEQSERFTKYLTSRSIEFLQGTTPIFNAEGPNDEGKYTVVVGIVWSGKSTRVAESVYNPTISLPQGPKKSLSIQNQLENLSDEVLAATLGVRMWWDEEGLPVVISFAQAKGTGSTIIAKKKTANRASHQIAQFVAEQIVSSASDVSIEEIHYYDDGSHTAFNLSEYKMKIEAIGPTIPLKGAGTVLYKKIVHPITEKRIVVNVVTWSPESNLIARELGKMSDDQATKMDATKGGTVFKNNQKSSHSNSVGTVTTTGLQGVSSDPDDF